MQLTRGERGVDSVWGWTPIKWHEFIKTLTMENFELFQTRQITTGAMFRYFVRDYGANQKSVYLTSLTFTFYVEEDEGPYLERTMEIGIGIVKYYQNNTNKWKYKAIRIGHLGDWQRLWSYRREVFGHDG